MRNLDPALKLIREFEGLKLKPYLCSAGVPTIGIGSTYYSDGVKVSLKDNPITESHAYELLLSRIKKDAERLETFLKKNQIVLNDNQFSALISFSYNLGLGPILSLGRGLNMALKTKDPSKIVKAIRLYDKVGKVALNGLTRRREAEVALFLS